MTDGNIFDCLPTCDMRWWHLNCHLIGVWKTLIPTLVSQFESNLHVTGTKKEWNEEYQKNKKRVIILILIKNVIYGSYISIYISPPDWRWKTGLNWTYYSPLHLHHPHTSNLSQNSFKNLKKRLRRKRGITFISFREGARKKKRSKWIRSNDFLSGGRKAICYGLISPCISSPFLNLETKTDKFLFLLFFSPPLFSDFSSIDFYISWGQVSVWFKRKNEVIFIFLSYLDQNLTLCFH